MSIDTHIDIDAARRFLHTSARVLELHRAAFLLDDASPGPVVDSLRAYRNDDGGFGHALEPDLRDPNSQVSATMSALEVLAEVGAADSEMVTGALRWLESVANPDGGLAHVLPTASDYPAAPWMRPSADSSFLTYPTCAYLHRLEVRGDWLDRATEWCWQSLESAIEPPAYTICFGMIFLDVGPDRARAEDVVKRLAPRLRPDGTMPVEGGIEGEHVSPVEFSPEPGGPSRTMFTDEQISTDLDHLEGRQLDDGGWDFDFLHWSPAQSVEWRGLSTLRALRVLRANGRL